MPTIIPNSQFQRNPKRVVGELDQKGCIITNHGVPQMIVLPYFEHSDTFMEDYYEQFEISKNRKKLQQELEDSAASGDSDLVL